MPVKTWPEAASSHKVHTPHEYATALVGVMTNTFPLINEWCSWSPGATKRNYLAFLFPRISSPRWTIKWRWMSTVLVGCASLCEGIWKVGCINGRVIEEELHDEIFSVVMASREGSNRNQNTDGHCCSYMKFNVCRPIWNYRVGSINRQMQGRNLWIMSISGKLPSWTSNKSILKHTWGPFFNDNDQSNKCPDSSVFFYECLK